MHQRGLPIKGALEQDLYFSAGVLDAVDTRRHHTRIIEYQQISWIQERGEIAKQKIPPLPIARLQQQPAGGALRQGPLSDEFRGKLEVKIGAQHAKQYYLGRSLVGADRLYC
jgi:hypothetical protein